MTFLRTELKRYKKHFLIALFSMLGLAIPLFAGSNLLSVSLLDTEITHYPLNEVNVEYALDLEIFENYIEKTYLPDIIIEAVEDAEEEIYIPMFSFNIIEIKDALYKASDRGVNVVLIYNYTREDDLEEFLHDNNGRIDIKYVQKNFNTMDQYVMHHKFVLIDPELSSRKLITGSWNWTYFEQDEDPNIIIVTKDKEIINSYYYEIKQFLKNEFGLGKLAGFDFLPWEKTVNYPNNDYVKIWFSPGRHLFSVKDEITNLIDQADETIEIGVPYFNTYELAKKLLDKAENGVNIRLIVDKHLIEDGNSIIPRLRREIESRNIDNFEVLEAGDRDNIKRNESENKDVASIFHYHMMIIDSQIVLSSSANWTYNGFYNNDEDTLVIKNKETVDRFSNIFDNFYRNLLNT